MEKLKCVRYKCFFLLPFEHEEYCHYDYISFCFKARWIIFFRVYTQRNLFEILLKETEIRLYLPFSDWFGTERMLVWFHINLKVVNKIWFRFDLIRPRKYFSVCSKKDMLKMFFQSWVFTHFLHVFLGG